MEGKPRQVHDYIVGESNPFREWLLALKDRDSRARIEVRIRRIEEFGSFGKCKPVGEGVHELIVDFGPGYRVYFGIDGETLVLLLGGGDKSSQARDIKTAKIRWKDYNNAKEK